MTEKEKAITEEQEIGDQFLCVVDTRYRFRGCRLFLEISSRKIGSYEVRRFDEMIRSRFNQLQPEIWKP